MVEQVPGGEGVVADVPDERMRDPRDEDVMLADRECEQRQQDEHQAEARLARHGRRIARRVAQSMPSFFSL